MLFATSQMAQSTLPGCRISDTDVVVNGRVLKVAQLEQEWFDDVLDPAAFTRELKESPVGADLFTFWQRIPDSAQKFDYPVEWESLAVLPIQSYDHWWNDGIKSRTRGLIRKSEKMGVSIRETQFDDDFVRGMVEIFNEAPIRQGRKFWHYGKDFETVRKEFSRYLFREDIIGAYFEDELIGFVMLGNAGSYTSLGQIISKIKHRDKATNNALMAKAVEITARKSIPYLAYNYWNETGLTEFKRRNGFTQVSVPRYFIPLTLKGRIALGLGAHRSLADMLPKQLVAYMKRLRQAVNERRYGAAADNASTADNAS